MTNAELNIAIAKLIYPDDLVEYEEIAFCNDGERAIVVTQGISKDYCNNWNDLMPLVVEHKIDLQCNIRWNKDNTDMWEACHWDAQEADKEYITNNNNPKRALAECLLKVLTAKAEDY